jgi:hypothetical protein
MQNMNRISLSIRNKQQSILSAQTHGHQYQDQIWEKPVPKRAKQSFSQVDHDMRSANRSYDFTTKEGRTMNFQVKSKLESKRKSS